MALATPSAVVHFPAQSSPESPLHIPTFALAALPALQPPYRYAQHQKDTRGYRNFSHAYSSLNSSQNLNPCRLLFRQLAITSLRVRLSAR